MSHSWYVQCPACLSSLVSSQNWDCVPSDCPVPTELQTHSNSNSAQHRHNCHHPHHCHHCHQPHHPLPSPLRDPMRVASVCPVVGVGESRPCCGPKVVLGGECENLFICSTPAPPAHTGDPPTSTHRPQPSQDFYPVTQHCLLFLSWLWVTVRLGQHQI